MKEPKEWIFKYNNKLVTPVGSFTVSDGEKLIDFSVIKNGIDWPIEVYDENNEKVVGTISTETNYRIVIPTEELEIGREYRVSFSAGKWNFCASDEHTTCYSAIIGNWAVGIGSYDPCDQLKEDQMFEMADKNGNLSKGFVQELEYYDESEFQKYTSEVLDDYNGYIFKLFDYSDKYIFFEVAWIKIDQYPSDEYEGALGVWLT